uniref:Palmitoyltransferase n=1 Tax=Zooxanthella nutricula TaxID=1333877 RepID=A0A7S2K2G3_9DINO
MPTERPMLAWQPGVATACVYCSAPRPERAHHCRLCGVCILRMDHHCPWLNNCVGFKNHKFFLLATFYGLVACVVGVLTALPELALCLDAAVRSAQGLRLNVELPWSATCAMLTFGAFAALLASILAAMLVAHGQLLAANMTSVEGHYRGAMNPFDLGGPIANVAQVFGAPGFDWLLPVAPWRPLSDGITFFRAGKAPEAQDGDDAYGEELWTSRYRAGAKAGPVARMFEWLRIGRPRPPSAPTASPGRGGAPYASVRYTALGSVPGAHSVVPGV